MATGQNASGQREINPRTTKPKPRRETVVEPSRWKHSWLFHPPKKVVSISLNQFWAQSFLLGKRLTLVRLAPLAFERLKPQG